MKLNKRNLAAIFGASMLAGCSTSDNFYPSNRSGNFYGPPPGANIVQGTPELSYRQTGNCTVPRQIRERHYNTAGQMVRDFQVGSDLVVIPCGTELPPRGYCYLEKPDAITGVENGRPVAVLSGISTRPITCPGSAPYNYSQW